VPIATGTRIVVPQFSERPSPPGATFTCMGRRGTQAGQRDEKARRIVLEEIAAGASISAAARKAGIVRQAVYNWVNRGDAELAAALDAARRKGTISMGCSSRGAPPPAEVAACKAMTQAQLERLALDTMQALLRADHEPTRLRAAERLYLIAQELPRDADAEQPDAPAAGSKPRARDKGLSPEAAAARFRVVG